MVKKLSVDHLDNISETTVGRVRKVVYFTTAIPPGWNLGISGTPDLFRVKLSSIPGYLS